MAYLEILIAAVAAFALGAVWYTALFGKVWQAETGITNEQAKPRMAMTHGLAFLMMLVLAYSTNFVIGFHDVAEQTFVHGAFHGMLSALTVAVPAVAINYLYQLKSMRLFLIDAAYVVAFMALEGGILAALKL